MKVRHAKGREDSMRSMKLTSNASRDSLELTKTWTSIDYDSLKEIPIHFPVGRTSTVVVDCSDPCTIAKRITDCLQKLSITAEFNSSDASLFAEALDHTTFNIRLFKNKNMKSSQGILVELQRAAGDSFNFVKFARAILASARGEVVDISEVVMGYIPACISREPFESNEKYIVQVEELLKNSRSDAVLLGIESLLLLTDRERSQVSSSAAEAVLRGVGRPFIKDFINGCIHGSMGLFPEASTLDYAFRQYDNMRSISLAVLANSLQTLSASRRSVICSLLESEEWMGQSGIVDALLFELSEAENKSHNAYHAARCLNSLLDSSSEMKNMLVKRGLPGVIKVSQSVGQRKHLLLAQECDIALAELAEV